jgi:hypothetical protein
LGRPDGERGLNHLADKALQGEQKLTTIMARATAWGKPTVGELSHHATQNAAARSECHYAAVLWRRPRTEARSVIPARISEQSAENQVHPLAPDPVRSALRANIPKPNTAAPPSKVDRKNGTLRARKKSKPQTDLSSTLAGENDILRRQARRRPSGAPLFRPPHRPSLNRRPDRGLDRLVANWRVCRAGRARPERSGNSSRP